MSCSDVGIDLVELFVSGRYLPSSSGAKGIGRGGDLVELVCFVILALCDVFVDDVGGEF